MNDLFVRIRFLLPSLPRAEKAIASALLENPEAITHLTLAEIARESGSSEASIIRFCKRMGWIFFYEGGFHQSFGRRNGNSFRRY